MRTQALWRRTGNLMSLVLALLMAIPFAASGQTLPKRIALLVGVGNYTDASMPDLDGPPHDVAALREVLIRRWGFRPQDIKTLVDGEATRDNIATELAALSRRSAAKDEVLVYFSGHGTSALDDNISAMGVALPHSTGAFVPADFKLQARSNVKDLMVGRTDLVPVFSALEAAGRSLWVISDSCYSGQQVRSSMLVTPGDLPERMIPLVLGKAASQQIVDLARMATPQKIEPYPYRATAFLSASGEGERAKDVPRGMLGKMPTLDGKPHGAMTDALLRVLEGQVPGDLDGDGWMTLNEVHRATSDFMAQRAYGHSPMRLPSVAEDAHGLGNRAVLNIQNVAKRSSQQPPQPLRLRIESASPALVAAISGVPDVQIAKPGSPADIVLMIKGSQQGLISASGDLLAGLPVAETGRAVAQIRQLAWAQHLRGLAEKYRRAALQVAVDPAEQGSNFVPGQLISFVVRPDKNATLVLLNINSEGKVGVLYPYSPAELQPLAAGLARHIPGNSDHQRIKVQEPFGMDMQFIFAFDEPPAGLGKLLHLDNADPGDSRLLAFERSLSTLAGKFTFATSELRTLKP